MKKGYIVIMIIGIVAVGVIVAFAVNSLNNNNKTISMLEKYDMTQTDLDYLKNISKGIEDKINKENIDVPIDICYSKGNYLVVRGFKANNNSNKGTEPMDISAPKRMYIVISKDETKVYNEDDSLELLGTAKSYYDNLFKTSNQYLVQFSSLDELLELIK